MDFNQIPAGTFLWSEKQGSYYIKPQQNEMYHLDGMVIDLFTGEIKHYSHLGEIEPRDKNAIHW